jgi:hypothetical protein
VTFIAVAVVHRADHWVDRGWSLSPVPGRTTAAPDKGDVIPQSGGLRKVRMRLPGRGKSGGARVIYLHLPKYQTIVLFYLYTKAQRENLSAEQLKRLRQAAAIIKEEFEL